MAVGHSKKASLFPWTLSLSLSFSLSFTHTHTQSQKLKLKQIRSKSVWKNVCGLGLGGKWWPLTWFEWY